jgi:hypothetical protein
MTRAARLVLLGVLGLGLVSSTTGARGGFAWR